jgi:hypothetical protein
MRLPFFEGAKLPNNKDLQQNRFQLTQKLGI